MERAEHDDPDGGSVPDHPELENDPANDTRGEADVPNARVQKVLQARAFIVLLLSVAVVGALAFLGFSTGGTAVGGTSIPVEESAVFDSPPAIEAAVLDGWRVTSDGDSLTSVQNFRMRCYFTVESSEDVASEYGGEDGTSGDVAASESILSAMARNFTQALNMRPPVGDFQKLNVPQASPGEPALEFLTMRLDYRIPGTGEPATVRFAARSMPSSRAVIMASLICPTSAIEGGNDPWKALMTNSTVGIEE